jgi:histidinol-phosphate aminotransferase
MKRVYFMNKRTLKNWFRPAVLSMKGYTPGEQPQDLRTIKLNTNESPYPPSAAVLKAVKGMEGARIRLYPEPTADTLRKALSRVYRWPLPGILVGNGSDEILSLLFHAAVGKGDLVQFPDITYSLYPVLAKICEARVKEVKLDGQWELPFAKFSPNARLTLWGHPNPPVGNCFDFKQMKAFCRKAKGLVLIDEAYVDFAEADSLQIARSCPNVLVLRSMSKSFSLAGARLGFVFGHPSVIEQLMKVKDSYNVNRVSQAVALAAMSPAGLKDMRQKVKRIKNERNRMKRVLHLMGFSVPESQANFLLATRRDGKGAEGLYKSLKKKRILIRYFPHPRLRSSLRITVGTPEQNNRLLAALKATLKLK